jgi:hypothetical protein
VLFRSLNSLTGAMLAPANWQSRLKPGDCYIIESNTPTLPSIYGQFLKPARTRYFHAKAYSTWCVEGKEDFLCIVEPTRILTRIEFATAREKNWIP